MASASVTGAAGFIGQAVIKDLLANGHQALGLARSDASAETVSKAGAEVHRGDLEDLESLKSGAKKADGVIHLAFIHDFSPEGFTKALKVDRDAIQAMGEAMEGTNNPLIIASGALVLAGLGGKPTEDTEIPQSDSPFMARALSETLVQNLSKEKKIRGMAVRLSPTVHGAGDKGFITILGGLAQKNGFVTNVNDGSSRWPAVHRLDAAALFRLAAEKGKAGGIYHGVAEEVPTGTIMQEIGKKLSLEVENKSQEEAMQLIGFFGMVVGADCPISSEKTQAELGWKPSHPGLIEDIQANYSW